MRKKGILILCQFFYPEYITSALLPYQTAEYLVENNYTVDVICGYPKEYLNEGKTVKTKEQTKGINICRIKYLQLSRNNKVLRLINYLSFVLMMFFQLPKLRKYRSVIVYSNPPILPIIAILGKKLFGIKLVYVSYDVYPEIAQETSVISMDGFTSKFMNKLNDSLYRNVDRVVALSNEMKEFLLKHRQIDESKIIVIPNWATEAQNETKEYTRNPNTPITISYLGNMGIPQDFETLLSAINHPTIKNNKDFQFIFAGHGNKKEVIQKFIDENRIDNVFIHGFLQGEKYKNVLDNTDLFVLSLKDELHGLAVPSKFYTYLAMNKPIIAIISPESDIYQEIQNFELGISVINGQSELLVKELIEFYKSKSKLDNKEVYNRYYSKEIQLNKYVKLFKGLLEGKDV